MQRKADVEYQHPRPDQKGGLMEFFLDREANTQYITIKEY
jgi:hypothetical protein